MLEDYWETCTRRELHYPGGGSGIVPPTIKSDDVYLIGICEVVCLEVITLINGDLLHIYRC